MPDAERAEDRRQRRGGERTEQDGPEKRDARAQQQRRRVCAARVEGALAEGEQPGHAEQ